MDAEQRMHAACARLRFSEGLRRRSAEARAEAAIQEATHFSRYLGADVSPSELRRLTHEGAFAPPDWSCDPGLAQALGIWRATWEALSALPPLNAPGSRLAPNVPVPQRLAATNRNAASFLVACGEVPEDDVAKPVDPAALRKVVQLSATLHSHDAVDRIAEIWDVFVSRPVFKVCSKQTGLVFVKSLLAEVGAEPTGVAVLSKWLAENATGAPGVNPTEDLTGKAAFYEMVTVGAVEGEDLALHVQAGLPKDAV